MVQAQEVEREAQNTTNVGGRMKVAGKIGTFRATLCISMAILNNTSTKRSVAASETHRAAKEASYTVSQGSSPTTLRQNDR
jgi:hypothetical protein